MLEFDGKQIRSVTAQGIPYVDNEGAEKFIDFSQCYENYLKHRLSPKSWASHKELNNATDEDRDKYVARVKAWKQVGDRNVLELFIEFDTEPRIRFQFATEDEWWAVRGTIQKVGWDTFDLT